MKRQILIPLVLTILAPVVVPMNLMAKAETTAPTPVVNQKLSAADEAEALEIADKFATEGNLEKAVLTLAASIKQRSKNPTVFYKFADFYQQYGGDAKMIENAYQKAIDLAIKAKDFKVQAESQVALAKVKMMLGKSEEGYRLLRQAKITYESLGDSVRASELDTEVTAITTDANNAGNFPRPVFRDGGSQGKNILEDLIKDACELTGRCSDG